MRWFFLAILSGLLALYYVAKARRQSSAPADGAVTAGDPDELDLDGEPLPARTPRRRVRIAPQVLAIFWGVLAGVFLIMSFFRVVPPGTAGVPVTLGSVGHQVAPGLHLVTPFTDFSAISTRTEQITMSDSAAGPDASVGVLGKDGSSATADATLIYRVDRADATRIFRELGTTYRDKVVRPAARACVRNAFRKYDIVDAATKNFEDVSTDIDACVHEKLESRGITVEDFQLRELTLANKVQDAVDSELAANRVEGTLSPEYLKYLYIKALEQFANSKNNSSIIVPNDANVSPIIGVPGADTSTTVGAP